MRLALSVLWPGPYDPFPVSRSAVSFRRAYTEAPEFHRDRSLLESDGDPWTINVIGHGLFGAEVYGRARQCGVGAVPSFAFAAGVSALWELGIESWNKRPSAIDLTLTPVLGVLLGETRVRVQRWLRGRPRTAWRRTTEILIDPIGEGERTWLATRC